MRIKHIHTLYIEHIKHTYMYVEITIKITVINTHTHNYTEVNLVITKITDIGNIFFTLPIRSRLHRKILISG